MSTSQSTIDYLLDQLRQAGHVRSRKMFGEYALYCDEKVVALVCDDRLFVKPTTAGRKLLERPVEAPPYPGAKKYFLIDEELIENHERLAALIRATAEELPIPAPRRRKARR